MYVVSIKAPALFLTLPRRRRRSKHRGQSERPPPCVRAAPRAGTREAIRPARNYASRANERGGLSAAKPAPLLTQKSAKQPDRRGTTEARQRARREHAGADKARRTKRSKKTKTALLYNRVYVTARGLAAASPRSVRRCGINGDYTTAPRP